jgi:polysaccharide transporter, PST family
VLKELKERLSTWRDGREVFANSGWLIVDKVARILLALAVSVALARSLGAERLGMLKYAIALVALCSSFANLGLYGIVVRELARSPEDADETLGTASILYFIGSAISFVICIGVAIVYLGNTTVTLVLMLILSIGVLFFVPRVYVLWFDARVRSKYAIYAKGLPSIFSAIGVVIAALLGADVYVFAIIIVSDTVLAAVALTTLGAMRKDIPRNLKFTATRMKYLLGKSWPLIASRVAVVLYLKIDQVMIAEMMGSADVGVYAVAAELSEVWYFIPAALATSAFAGMIKLLETDRTAYHQRRQDLLDMMVVMSGAIILFIVIVAGPVINNLYGDEFTAAAGILRIHIFASPFIFMGYVLSKTIIAEDYLKFSLGRHLFGAVVNIGLNFLLIPRIGLYGAAWATVISYACGAYLACAFHKDARRMFGPMTQALLLPLRPLMRKKNNG